MKYVLIAILVLSAGLLGFFGIRTIKQETTLEGRVMSAAGMTLFVTGLLYLAYRLWESPLP